MHTRSNFVITGWGRSGTMFLADLLNMSEKWNVIHEYPGDRVYNDAKGVAPRFDQDYYGEVNSYLRRILDDLPVKKKALILRDPLDVWISVSNRKSQQMWDNILARMSFVYDNFFAEYADKYTVIDFEKMTTSTMWELMMSLKLRMICSKRRIKQRISDTNPHPISVQVFKKGL